MNYIWSEIAGAPFLKVATDDIASGVVFGFGGKGFFSPDESRQFQEAFGASKVLALKQTHSDKIASYAANLDEREKPEADGWCMQRDKVEKEQLLFLVSTADCLPVVMVSRNLFFLIHAGWRGVQGQILIKALQMANEHKEEIEQVYLGPAADPMLYEVGKEFFEYFPASTLIPSDSGDKYFFNLYQAATEQLRGGGYKGTISSPDIYTMSDDRFHSYRVSGKEAGRNLSFIGVSAN